MKTNYVYQCIKSFQNYGFLLLRSLVTVLALVILFLDTAVAGSYDDFFKAIRFDDAEEVSSLLKSGFDPNTPTEDGQTPLIVSIKLGSSKTTRVLASAKGLDIDRTNLQDESPLMLAAFNGNLELTKYLVSQGAEVNKPGWSPLHYAATKGHIDIMQFLLSESAYIDAESPNGTTPLMMAAKFGTLGAVKLLLDEGADPTIRNNLQLNAVDFASNNPNPQMLSYLKTQHSIWIMSHHWCPELQ